MLSTNPIIDRHIKVALVGCGRISNNHLKAIASFPNDLELVALCDLDNGSLYLCLESWRQLYQEINPSLVTPGDPILFNSIEALLESKGDNKLMVDLVIIATPSGLHSIHSISAANHSINVCTEKPMATRMCDAKKMIRACDENKVQLFVVKQNRFNSTLQLVRRQIQKKRFGRLSMVSVNVFWQRPQSYYDQASWRGTWEFDGGALMNQASHYIDLLEWIVGPIDSVSASIATLGRNIEAEDTAAIQLRWKSGTLGTMAVTMLTYPENLEGSLTLIGDKGVVKVAGKAVNKIEHWDFEQDDEDDMLVKNCSYETTSVYGFGHTPYYLNMINVLRGRSEAECSGREGIKSLEIIIASYISAREQKTIKLPLSIN